MLLTEFLDRVYRPLRLRQRSTQTVRLHHCAIRRLSLHLERPATLNDLANEIGMSEFLEARAARRSPYTVERERSSLMALARLAWERRLIEVLPQCPAAPLPSRTPTAWSVEQVGRLFAAAEAEQGFLDGVPAPVWWRGLLLLCWETGERIGALLACETDHLIGDHLTVPAAARKGGRADRVYLLTPETTAAVLAAHAPGQRSLLHWPSCRTGLWSAMRRLCRRAGLHGRRLGFHQLRRTAASHYAAAGGDAATFLGHAPGSGGRVASLWYVDPRLRPATPAAILLPTIPDGAEKPRNPREK